MPVKGTALRLEIVSQGVKERSFQVLAL